MWYTGRNPESILKVCGLTNLWFNLLSSMSNFCTTDPAPILCWGCELRRKFFNPLTPYAQNYKVFLSPYFQTRFKMSTCTSAPTVHSCVLTFISPILFDNIRPFCPFLLLYILCSTLKSNFRNLKSKQQQQQ